MNLFLPLPFAKPGLQAGVFILGIFLVAVLVGLTESVMARLKLLNVPKVLAGSAALSLIALMLKLVEYYQ